MKVKINKKPKIKWKNEYDQLFKKYRAAVNVANGNQQALEKMRKERNEYKAAYERLLMKED